MAWAWAHRTRHGDASTEVSDDSSMASTVATWALWTLSVAQARAVANSCVVLGCRLFLSRRVLAVGGSGSSAWFRRPVVHMIMARFGRVVVFCRRLRLPFFARGRRGLLYRGRSPPAGAGLHLPHLAYLHGGAAYWRPRGIEGCWQPKANNMVGGMCGGGCAGWFRPLVV